MPYNCILDKQMLSSNLICPSGACFPACATGKYARAEVGDWGQPAGDNAPELSAIFGVLSYLARYRCCLASLVDTQSPEVCQLSVSAQQHFIVTPPLQLVGQVELISETGPKCPQ